MVTLLLPPSHSVSSRGTSSISVDSCVIAQHSSSQMYKSAKRFPQLFEIAMLYRQFDGRDQTFTLM